MPYPRGSLAVCFRALAMLAVGAAWTLAVADEPIAPEEELLGKIVFLQSAVAEDGSEVQPPIEELPPDESAEYGMGELGEPLDFCWQVAPSGLIYHSYLAGPHEPRISITPFFSS